MDSTSKTVEAARRKVNDLADAATDEATRAFDEKASEWKGAAEERGERIASAAEAAQNEVRSGSLEEMALQQVGDTVEHAVNYFKSRSPRDLMDDVETVARRHPLLFLGGAALAGFAAARFLKAGPAPHQARIEPQDPWTGHLNGSETGGL